MHGQEAEDDLSKALSIDPDTQGEVEEARDEMQSLKAKDRVKDAQMWRKAFQRRVY